MFNSYIRWQGSIEPLFSAFCNGTTVTCEGLSQWGTVTLAQQGMTPYKILTYYYGDDIDIISNVAVQTNTPSFPGYDLMFGYSGGDAVRTIQIQLNRISRNYSTIPKIGEVTGSFDSITQDAVTAFQSIFSMPATGVVNEATWYRIAYIFLSVKRLAELNSEWLTLEETEQQFNSTLRIGMQRQDVRVIQYYLAVQPVSITGYFGAQTEQSVQSFQQVFGLPETDIVDQPTWFLLYDAYLGILESVPLDETVNDIALYPGVVLREGTTSEYVRLLQTYLSYIHETYPEIGAVNATGYFGPITCASVLTFQKQFGYPESGIVGAATWDAIVNLYADLKYSFDKQRYQTPWYTIF
ncbi:MAG: peptidoglycan-binding protein [Ruminococcus sp.]|nr:peptidoglycan-binding protein [Ruminococcus sp.]